MSETPHSAEMDSSSSSTIITQKWPAGAAAAGDTVRRKVTLRRPDIPRRTNRCWQTNKESGCERWPTVERTSEVVAATGTKADYCVTFTKAR